MAVSMYEVFDLWPEGEQSPADKPYLRHSSIAAWCRSEGLVGPLYEIADTAERERRLHEYGELHRYLFSKHLASLTEAEQQEYRTRKHPSQSHRFRARAQPIAEQLRAELASRGFTAVVDVGCYHLDRLVLFAESSAWPAQEEWPTWPWFFRGFEVKYGLTTPCL